MTSSSRTRPAPQVLDFPKVPDRTFNFIKQPSRTVSGHIKNFGSSFDMSSVISALSKKNLMKHIETVQSVSNRLEILFTRVDVKEKFLVDGLTVGNNHVNFRDAAIKFFRVTVTGLPPEISSSDFAAEMKKFGTLLKFYDVYKYVNGHKVKNGNRVYQFQQLTDTIPTRIIADNRLIRLIYNKNISRDFCSDSFWQHLLEINSWSYSPSENVQSEINESNIVQESDPSEETESIKVDETPLRQAITKDLASQPSSSKINNLISNAESVDKSISREITLPPPHLNLSLRNLLSLQGLKVIIL